MMIFFLCLIKKGFRDDKDLESPPILSSAKPSWGSFGFEKREREEKIS